MPTVITGTEGGGLVICNPDGDAVTGRWAVAPEIPDLCYRCLEPGSLRHRQAVGYTEDATGLRRGFCDGCRESLADFVGVISEIIGGGGQ